MRGTRLVFLALLLPPAQARAAEDIWKCRLLESHHFVNGRDVTQKGGGDYRIEIKARVINLSAGGRFIIGYDIVENSEYRLFGERRYPAGDGETMIAKLTLDKLNGRIVQTGISQKGASSAMRELINGRCFVPQEGQPQ